MIKFHYQDLKFTPKNKTLLKKWMSSTIKTKNRKIGVINFIFCSDEYLSNINQQYLNHNTYTDIITFDYSKDSPKKAISGDIFISIERVNENAKYFSKSEEEELHRVMIHGILHLLGYKDKTKLAKMEMTKQENACLKNLLLK